MPEFNSDRIHTTYVLNDCRVVGMFSFYHSSFSPLLSFYYLTCQMNLINTTVGKLYSRCYRREIMGTIRIVLNFKEFAI